MSKLGIDNYKPNEEDKPKKVNNEKEKVPTHEVWGDAKVAIALQKEIVKLRENKSNYITLSKLASRYLLTVRDFRAKCSGNNELANLLEIYNGVYTEHIMTEAIKTGKINTQTEEWLKNTLQSYTSGGFEQNIKWYVNDPELVDVNGDKYEIVPDIDRNTADEELIWGNNQDEDNKE